MSQALKLSTNKQATNLSRIELRNSDKGEILELFILNPDGTPYDLTGKSVVFNENKDGDKFLSDSNVTIVDANSGHITYQVHDQVHSDRGTAWFDVIDSSGAKIGSTSCFYIEVRNGLNCTAYNTTYISDLEKLKQQMEALIAQADGELKSELQKAEQQLDRGPKGDKGDTGPQGPKGDTGPQGLQGAPGKDFTNNFNPKWDRYSNKYHLGMPDTGFMNDIQSGFYRDGIWHIYFLYNGDSRLDRNGEQKGGNGTEWYHATTTDWVKWNYEGVAIHKYKTDWGDIATGTIFEDNENLFGKGYGTIIAFATGYAGVKGQNIMVYYSTDNGYNFQPYQSTPALLNGRPDGTYPDFRDPYIFHMDNKWIMYIAEGNKFGVYVSDKPTTGYVYKGAYMAPHGVLECPNLFLMNTNGDRAKQKWVLFYGGNGGDDTTTGTYASVGHLDSNYVFISEQDDIRIDQGPDFYGAKVFADTSQPDVNSQVLAVGWVGNWGYSTKVPNEGRMGNASLTRAIKLQQTDTNFWFTIDILGPVQDYLDNPIVERNLTSNISLPMFKGDAFYFKIHLKDMSQYKGKLSIKFYGNGYDTDFNTDFGSMSETAHRYCKDFVNNAIFSKDRTFPLFMGNIPDVWLEFYVDRTTIEHITADRRTYTMAKYPQGRSHERITITSSSDIKFDYEYYQIINKED